MILHVDEVPLVFDTRPITKRIFQCWLRRFENINDTQQQEINKTIVNLAEEINYKYLKGITFILYENETPCHFFYSKRDFGIVYTIQDYNDAFSF